MELSDFARKILYGERLEDKLQSPPSFEDDTRSSPLTQPPLFPGRPPELARIGKAIFPKEDKLKDPKVRAQVLHFFANHELLALELMALMLLKFPDAPAAFRAGIARTMQEEQNHMRLYLKAMRELGMEFGEQPLSAYFWNALKTMRDPMEFIVQMSLTFEQANLDYALYFRDRVAAQNDAETARVLDQVYREEIGHVRHGLTWFNRWRPNPEHESDWQAYLRLLPPPMTPRRARGLGFAAQARREAGLSETFIREMEVHSGSRGRPPVVWLYNASCEAEIARGKPGFTPSETVRRLSEDLEHVPMFLANEGDILLVKNSPSPEWLKSLQELGMDLPVFHTSEPSRIPDPKLSGLEPWGWSPESFEKLKPLTPRLIDTATANGPYCRALFQKSSYAETGIGQFFRKDWSAAFLREWLIRHPDAQKHFGDLDWVGQAVESTETAVMACEKLLAKNLRVLLKAPLSTSGQSQKRVNSREDLTPNCLGWIRNTIEAQGQILVEPLLDKICDLSMQIEVSADGVSLLPVRRFLVGAQHEYLGTLLGSKFPGFTSDQQRFQSECRKEWNQLARDLGEMLRTHGYQGPAGLDALLWKTPAGELRLKPLVELNPRWTMGRVALALERWVRPGETAAWLFLPPSALERLKAFPPHFESTAAGQRLVSGAWITRDLTRAPQHVVTALITAETLRQISDLVPAPVNQVWVG